MKSAPVPNLLRLESRRFRSRPRSTHVRQHIDHATADRHRHRPAGDRHDPHPLHGCRRGGEERPSRHADGAGAGGVHDLEGFPALRPGRSVVAQPRPVRPLLRPRLDAPLRADPPRGHPARRPILPRPRPAGRVARRDPAVPPARQRLRRPSRAPHDRGHRDDHRAARPGLRQLGRHGNRIALAGRPVQPAGADGLRLRHLRALQRRRPDGGRGRRGGLDRRPPRPGEPVLDLRRQRDHDRGGDAPRLQRERAAAVRGPRLAGRGGRRCQRHGGHRPGLGGLQGGARPAHDDRRQERDRLRGAEEGGFTRGARRAARRGGDQGGEAGLRLAGRAGVPRAGRGAHPLRRHARRPRGRGPRRLAEDGGRPRRGASAAGR